MTDNETIVVEKLKGYSLRDLRLLPKPEYLIDGLMPDDAYAFIYGAPGSCKTFGAIDMACCVVAGIPFHGRKVKQGKANYFFGEGRKGVGMRIDAWLAAHPDVDEELIMDGLQLFPWVPNVLDIELYDRVAETAKDCSLTVIDTLARSIRGMNENSATDMGIANAAFQKIRDKGDCAVAVVHHSGKDGVAERGSTAMRGDADTLLLFRRTQGGNVELSTSKMKDGDDNLRMAFELKASADSVVLSKIALTAANNMSQEAKQGIRSETFTSQAKPSGILDVLAARDAALIAANNVQTAGGLFEASPF